MSKGGHLLQTETQSNSFPFVPKNHENKLAPNYWATDDSIKLTYYGVDHLIFDGGVVQIPK